MTTTAMATVPLTTTFTPPADCTTNIYLYESGNGGYHYMVAALTPTTCFPSGWQSTASTVFSPGICPSGYTQACSKLNSIGTVTETQATCCPTGYACYTPNIFNYAGQECVSAIPSTYVATVTVLNSVTSVLSTTTTTLRPTSDGVNDYGVRIRYQSTDFVSSTSSSSSSSSTQPPSTGTQSNTASASSSSSSTSGIANTPLSSTASPSATSSPNALSNAAWAGIGVGVAAVLVALVGIILFLLRRQRRRRDRARRGLGEGASMNHDPAVDLMTPAGSPLYPPSHEAASGSIHEADTKGYGYVYGGPEALRRGRELGAAVAGTGMGNGLAPGHAQGFGGDAHEMRTHAIYEVDSGHVNALPVELAGDMGTAAQARPRELELRVGPRSADIPRGPRSPYR